MIENMLQAKKDYSRFSLALLSIAGITALLQMVLALIWKEFLVDTAMGQWEIMRWILTMGPMYLVAVPVSLRIMKKIPAEALPPQKLGGIRFFVLMLIGMPIMYAGNLLGNFLSALLSGGTAENALLDYIIGNPLYAFIFTVLLAPFLEELIFRKQLIDRLGKYGEKTAVIFSAVTFGLFHMNLFQFFYAFGLGLIFAYVYTRTRRLRYPVFMHMIVNFMGSVIAPFLLSLLDFDAIAATEAGTATTAQIMQVLPAMLAYLAYFFLYMCAVIAGLVLLIIRWKKRQFCPASHELPVGTAGKIVYWNPGMICFMVFCLVSIVLALF